MARRVFALMAVTFLILGSSRSQEAIRLSAPYNEIRLGPAGLCIQNAVRMALWSQQFGARDTTVFLYAHHVARIPAPRGGDLFVHVDSIRGRGANRQAFFTISWKTTDSLQWIQTWLRDSLAWSYNNALPLGGEMETQIELDSWLLYGVESGSIDTDEKAFGNASARISVGDPVGPNVQMSARPLQILAGKPYTLSYWKKASVRTPFFVFLHQDSAPYTARGLQAFDTATTSWTRSTFTFTPALGESLTTVDNRLRFSFDGLAPAGATVWFDSLYLGNGTRHSIGTWEEITPTRDSTRAVSQWLPYAPAVGDPPSFKVHLDSALAFSAWLEKVVGDPTKNGGRDQLAKLHLFFSMEATERFNAWLDSLSREAPPW